MPHRSVRRAASAAPVALALGLAVLPSSAGAADAPTRTIGIGVDGQRTSSLRPIAVANDGKEVLQYDFSNLYVRDVVAGTTRVVLASPGGVAGASTDLRTVLVDTWGSRVAADTDDEQDLYLWNRTTGAFTLVTGADVNLDRVGEQRNAWADLPVLSGDGKVAQFGVTRYLSANGVDGTWKYETWRYDASTGRATKRSDTRSVVTSRLDDAGRVSLSYNGIRIDNRTLPLPYDPAATTANPIASVSPDGSAVAFQGIDRKTLSVVNTASGVVRKVTLPTWLQTTPFSVIAPYNGGGSVLLQADLNRPEGKRSAYGRLDVGTGVLTQIGGDIPATNTTDAYSAIAPNLQFAANNLFLAQLGTTPLPGTEPGTPSNAKATDYFDIGDATCHTNIFGIRQWTRPWFTMRSGAQGADTRPPVKADVTVTVDKTGAVANRFSITPGKSRDLSVGRTGGWTVSARVTLTGGAVLDGKVTVPAHGAPTCSGPFG